MKAAVFHGAGDVRYEEVAAPELSQDDDVLVEVTACGICGTDAAEWSSGPHFVPLHTRHPGSGHLGPMVLGHELSGRILSMGSAVEHFSVGQRVVSGGGSWCGECRWCRAGRLNLCRSWWVMGLNADGALAERVRVPARMLMPVPDGVSDEVAALAQPLAVAVHGVTRSGVQAGQRVAVIGIGGIGALTLPAVADRQPRMLLAADISARQLAGATALGATHLIDPARSDSVHQALELTGGEGFDVVIEASGAPPALALASALVARGGTLLLLGLQEHPVTIDLASLTRREVSVATTISQVQDHDLPEALRLLATTDVGELVLDQVIGLSEVVAKGILPLAEGRATGKTVVTPFG